MQVLNRLPFRCPSSSNHFHFESEPWPWLFILGQTGSTRTSLHVSIRQICKIYTDFKIKINIMNKRLILKCKVFNFVDYRVTKLIYFCLVCIFTRASTKSNFMLREIVRLCFGCEKWRVSSVRSVTGVTCAVAFQTIFTYRSKLPPDFKRS